MDWIECTKLHILKRQPSSHDWDLRLTCARARMAKLRIGCWNCICLMITKWDQLKQMYCHVAQISSISSMALDEAVRSICSVMWENVFESARNSRCIDRTEPEETTKPKHISNDRTRARTPINIIILRVCWRIDLSHKVHQSQNRIINQWLVKWNIYLMSISSPIYWDLIFWQRNRRTDPNRSIGKHQNIINDHQFGTKRSLEALKLH